MNEDWLEYLDFRDPELTAMSSRFRADYLFHLGALTDLEYCETHPEEAYATNAIPVENAVTSRTSWTSRFSTSEPRASSTADKTL